MSSDGGRRPQALHVIDVQLGGDLRSRSKPRRSRKLVVLDEPVWMPREGLPAGGRDECRGGERPCPYVKCRFHLWRVDGVDRRGYRHRGWPPGTTIAPRWLEYPTPACCALDVAEAAARDAGTGNLPSYPRLAKLLGISADAFGRHVRAAIARVKRLAPAEDDADLEPMEAQRYPVTVDPIFGCWLWTGPKAPNGYPVMRLGSRDWAHRAVYEAERGEIPAGLVLDHLCRRTRCVAPAHLEPVSKDDNERAKSWRARARRPHCPKGHPMALEAMVTPEGGRICRACSRGGL